MGFFKNAAEAALKLNNKITNKVTANSPEILLGVGIVASVAAVVTACKATTKVEDILDERDDRMDKVEEVLAENTEEYTEEDARKDRMIIRVQTFLKLAKLYSVPAILLVLSIVCILGSHNILSKRYAASVAAYTTLEKGFKEYRERVVERFGEDVDYQLKNNIKAEKIDEEVTDENGKTKKKKSTVNVADPNAEDIYTRYFTRMNPNWNDDEEDVLWFLTCQQRFLNERLKNRGHITLNEALDALGMKTTNAGLVVGWIYDFDHPNGDNYIQFKVNPVKLRNDAGELEDCYSVEFNCDGMIYEKLR